MQGNYITVMLQHVVKQSVGYSAAMGGQHRRRTAMGTPAQGTQDSAEGREGAAPLSRLYEAASFTVMASRKCRASSTAVRLSSWGFPCAESMR